MAITKACFAGDRASRMIRLPDNGSDGCVERRKFVSQLKNTVMFILPLCDVLAFLPHSCRLIRL